MFLFKIFNMLYMPIYNSRLSCFPKPIFLFLHESICSGYLLEVPHLNLVLLNPAFANSVDPDQLASEEAY